jgi:hypothetical protein
LSIALPIAVTHNTHTHTVELERLGVAGWECVGRVAGGGGQSRDM